MKSSNEQIASEVREFIADGHTEKALAVLQEAVSGNPYLQNRLILVQNLYRKWQQEEMEGLEPKKGRLTSINKKILGLADELSGQAVQPGNSAGMTAGEFFDFFVFSPLGALLSNRIVLGALGIFGISFILGMYNAKQYNALHGAEEYLYNHTHLAPIIGTKEYSLSCVCENKRYAYNGLTQHRSVESVVVVPNNIAGIRLSYEVMPSSRSLITVMVPTSFFAFVRANFQVQGADWKRVAWTISALTGYAYGYWLFRETYDCQSPEVQALLVNDAYWRELYLVKKGG